MPLPLRRLLNHLPRIPGGRGPLYVKSTWHKPTPFDQLQTHPPFRPMHTLPTNHFARGRRRQWLLRMTIRGAIAGGAVWLLWESARGLTLL